MYEDERVQHMMDSLSLENTHHDCAREGTVYDGQFVLGQHKSRLCEDGRVQYMMDSVTMMTRATVTMSRWLSNWPSVPAVDSYITPHRHTKTALPSSTISTVL